MKEETKSIIEDLPIGLISWYDFSKANDENLSILLIANEEFSSISKFLNKEKISCKYINSYDKLSEEKFDYIILIQVLEHEKEPTEILKNLKNMLKPNGKLLIGAENRLGVKYFCGEKDKFTGRNFDGIENYKMAKDIIDDGKGRAYSKAELQKIIENAGFSGSFYSVLPSLEFPQLIYKENHFPEEDLSQRYFAKYNSPNNIFLEERFLYTDLIENNIFHQMANAFFIECLKENNEKNQKNSFSDVLEVTVSMDRGKEKALSTIIKSSKCEKENNFNKPKYVEKKSVYKDGEKRIQNIAKNTEDLINHKIDMICGKYENGTYIMPYIKGEILPKRFVHLFEKDTKKFILEMDKLRDIALNSSKHIGVDPVLGVILKRCYPDLVMVNAMYYNEKYYFFDQEEYIENAPANVIIIRNIHFAYGLNIDMQKTIPKQFFFDRYDISENCLEECNKIGWEYLNNLRNLDDLYAFWLKYEANPNMINNNRHRINYSAEEYQKIFVDIFKEIETKEIIVFGSGKFATKFIGIFGKDYNISTIIDNNEKKWGETFADIPIKNPQEVLENLDKNHRIIICVKNYIGIINQLKKIGVLEYSVYDPSISYPKKTKISTLATEEKSENKPYNIGYISGVFDMFHIGHLNLLKRAKEYCNHLIVGVVSDEGVIKYKKTEPVISCLERIEILNACKYVDEAVEIPLDFHSSIDAYNLYRYDCQFCGSDYEDDMYWIKCREFLRSKGSDLMFFPYTEGTSSTKLKEYLNNNNKSK